MGKLNFLTSFKHLSFLNFFPCPLVAPPSNLNNSLPILSNPFTILYTLIKSPLSLLHSNDVICILLRIPYYRQDLWENPRHSRVYNTQKHPSHPPPQKKPNQTRSTPTKPYQTQQTKPSPT